MTSHEDVIEQVRNIRAARQTVDQLESQLEGAGLDFGARITRFRNTLNGAENDALRSLVPEDASEASSE